MPVNSAARVGEHEALTWKFSNRTLSAASRSTFGVANNGWPVHFQSP